MKIQVKGKQDTAWSEMDYWSGYGPEWKADWEGQVRIPVTTMTRTYVASGADYPQTWSPDGAASLKFWAKDDGGTAQAKVYLDAIYTEPKSVETVKLVDFDEYEENADLAADGGAFSRVDDGLSVTAAPYGEGMRAKVPGYAAGKQMDLKLPQATYTDFGELMFSLEITDPTKYHFVFDLGNGEVTYAITQSTKILVRPEGEVEWTEMDYWGNYGPEFTASFKGDIRIPLSAYTRKWMADGKEYPKTLSAQAMTTVIIWAEDTGGDGGCVTYWDDLQGVKGTFPQDSSETSKPTVSEPTQEREDAVAGPFGMTVVPFQNFDNAQEGDILSEAEGTKMVWFSDPNVDAVATAVASPAGKGMAAKLGCDMWQEWVQTFIPVQEGNRLDDTRGIVFYIKRENVKKKDSLLNFTFALQQSDGDYVYTDSAVWFHPAGEGSWSEVDYYSGFGPNIAADMEGYLFFDYAGFSKNVGDVPEQMDVSQINRIQLWVNNFGGVHGDFIIDELCGAADISVLKDSGTESSGDEWEDVNPSSTGSGTGSGTETSGGHSSVPTGETAGGLAVMAGLAMLGGGLLAVTRKRRHSV